MKFKNLAEYFYKIEVTASRVEMTKIIAELFAKINEDEIDKVLYLLQGRLAPQYVKIDFGMGEKMLIKASVSALGVDHGLFMKSLKSSGDIGHTVEELRKQIVSITERDLSITEVFEKLDALAHMSGDGSQERKLSLLVELIQTLDSLSCRYIMRIPTNTLRLGFSDMTILDAFSWMLAGDKSLRPVIENAYHLRPDLGFLGKQIKSDGVKGLEKVTPKVFTPILMMRAQRVGSSKDIFDKVESAIIEPKFDGFRLQVHYDGKTVKLFSRGLEDVTYMYPDIVEGVKKELKVKSIIFEGEAIGFDPYTQNFLPFQETVQRKRKYDIAEKALEIPLKMFVFEVLSLNGESLMNSPHHVRSELLEKIITHTKDYFTQTLILPSKVDLVDDKHLELIFDKSISDGLEGIMIKKKDGLYQPGARGWNWIKYKRNHSSKIEDTIDCVVMGYDKGKGKRAGFGIGAFLVGVYDEKEDLFKTVAKIGTGLSDDEWRELHQRCEKLKSVHKPALYDVDKLMDVDIWTTPAIVVEIKADEITRSPTHTAGRVMKTSKSGKAFDVDQAGYALRFPRLTRFRDDKKPGDATTLDEVEQMFSKQLTAYSH